MQPQTGMNHLLAELKRLYSNLSSRILHRRLKSYRSVSSAAIGLNALTSLDNHITRLCDLHGSDTRSAELPRPGGQSSHHSAQQTLPSEGSSVKELSSYFRENFSATSLQPHLANKLQDSSWHHINMAINYARQGNKENARIHSELANNAIQMLASYMSDDAYQTFCEQVQTHMNNMDKETR